MELDIPYNFTKLPQLVGRIQRRGLPRVEVPLVDILDYEELVSFNYQVIVPLLKYIPLARLMMLRNTSKDMASALNTNEALGMLKRKYNNSTATSLDQLYKEYNNSEDIAQAIRDDDAEIALFILSPRYGKNKDLPEYSSDDDPLSSDYGSLPNDYLPNLLTVAIRLNSRNVFAAVCPLMKDEIDRITTACEDHTEYLDNYLESIAPYLLETNDADMYEAFFSMLDSCDWGVEALFWECIGVVDDVNKAMWYSYSHVVMTGDDRAFNVMKKYFNEEPEEDMMKAYKYIRSLDFLVWLIETGKYTTQEMLTVARGNHKRFLKGMLSYEDVKKLEEDNVEDVLSCLKR